MYDTEVVDTEQKIKEIKKNNNITLLFEIKYLIFKSKISKNQTLLSNKVFFKDNGEQFLDVSRFFLMKNGKSFANIIGILILSSKGTTESSLGKTIT